MCSPTARTREEGLGRPALNNPQNKSKQRLNSEASQI